MGRGHQVHWLTHRLPFPGGGPRAPLTYDKEDCLGWGRGIQTGGKNPENFKFELVFPYSKETSVTLQWLQWAAADQRVPAHRDGPDAQRPGEWVPQVPVTWLIATGTSLVVERLRTPRVCGWIEAIGYGELLLGA